MKKFTKFAVCAAAFASAALSVAETINIADPAFIRPVVGKAVIANNQIKHSGKAFLFGKKKFAIDPAKKYIFKYTIVNNSDKTVIVYGGLDFYDSKNKSYPSWSWQTDPRTFTELVADAKKGDTEIIVKNGSAWIKHPSSGIIRDAVADGSDIPVDTKRRIADNIVKSTKDANGWVLTLSAPLKADVAKGTKIRQHFYGGYYYMNGANPTRVAPKQSRTVISTISGYQAAHGRFNQKNWPIGAKSAIFILLSDYSDTKGEIVIKDATISIE